MKLCIGPWWPILISPRLYHRRRQEDSVGLTADELWSSSRYRRRHRRPHLPEAVIVLSGATGEYVITHQIMLSSREVPLSTTTCTGTFQSRAGPWVV